MALPGHRRTSTEGKTRAKHFRLKVQSVGACTHCGATVRSHHACVKCGYYGGRQVLRVKVKKKR